ncbi:MAG: YraN family protein [Treponema sp.]|jgi:putative endonuclease|nr:YraN family protein [Treponema sp.]
MNSLGKLGKSGEEQAAAALESAGMNIIVKNFRSKHGEIDIVALDGETIVFAEVKTWAVYGMEDLRYSIDSRKKKKIIKTAKFFLSENLQYNKMSIRFDAIFVSNNSVTHLESAFMEGV